MVYFVDVEGQCIDVLDSGGLTILCMLHHQTRDCLVVMTAGVNIGYFQANPENGKLVEITKVNLKQILNSNLHKEIENNFFTFISRLN